MSWSWRYIALHVLNRQVFPAWTQPTLFDGWWTDCSWYIMVWIKCFKPGKHLTHAGHCAFRIWIGKRWPTSVIYVGPVALLPYENVYLNYWAAAVCTQILVSLLDSLYLQLEMVPKPIIFYSLLTFQKFFYTIQPLFSADKINFNLVCWSLDFLTDRSQFVKVNCCFSTKLLLSNDSPQGCCLSVLLYILIPMYSGDFVKYIQTL